MVIARKLVKIAKALLAVDKEIVVEGNGIRVSKGKFGDHPLLLEEMPEKGKKTLRQCQFSLAPWRYSDRALGILNYENVIHDAKLHSGMDYDQAKKAMLDSMSRLVKDINASASKAGGKTYEEKDLVSSWENKVHFLKIEPPNTKPFTVKGKDFTMDVSWTQFKTYSPNSDFQQADPFYSVMEETSSGAARKLFKILSANPDALKSMSWDDLSGWFDKNGIGYETNHSVWH